MARAAAKAPKLPLSLLVVHDCAQGSEEWFQLRLGLPTASHFATIMADGRDGGPSLTRTQYLHRLAGEVVTGILAEETFRSKAMDRGKEMEADAIADYEARRSVQVRRVGLGINFDGLKRCGASPDALVGFDGGLETKTMRPDLMIPLLERGVRMLPEHMAQVQGNMLVFERRWWDLKVYYPRMPDYTVRVYRNETYIKELHHAVEVFNHDLANLVARLKAMGA